MLKISSCLLHVKRICKLACLEFPYVESCCWHELRACQNVKGISVVLRNYSSVVCHGRPCMLHFGWPPLDRFLASLSRGHQQLVSLLFGIWFTMINNSHVNFMTTEALARSVAGSMFHSCATDPAMVEHASQVMQILIENFGVASMFGQENIEFFAETTRTSIHIKEKFRYHFQYPTEEILPRNLAHIRHWLLGASKWFVKLHKLHNHPMPIISSNSSKEMQANNYLPLYFSPFLLGFVLL